MIINYDHIIINNITNLSNISNITYQDDYIYNYFFDMSLLFFFLVIIFACKQVCKYYNCNQSNEINENNLQERILSTTRENNDISCNQNNVEADKEHTLPSYSEIHI